VRFARGEEAGPPPVRGWGRDPHSARGRVSRRGSDGVQITRGRAARPPGAVVALTFCGSGCELDGVGGVGGAEASGIRSGREGTGTGAHERTQPRPVPPRAARGGGGPRLRRGSDDRRRRVPGAVTRAGASRAPAPPAPPPLRASPTGRPSRERGPAGSLPPRPGAEWGVVSGDPRRAREASPESPLPAGCARFRGSCTTRRPTGTTSRSVPRTRGRGWPQVTPARATDPAPEGPRRDAVRRAIAVPAPRVPQTRARRARRASR